MCPTPCSTQRAGQPGLKPGALWLLRAYKAGISPVLAVFGARCRHAPTCSEYAALAVSRHGVWAGGWMALARVLRCRPWGSSGYDPVPQRVSAAPWYLPWRHGDWVGPQQTKTGAHDAP
ncbi:MAG: membrane protein insertion efficiency factor YidD [Pseudomonadota bacterium]